MIVIFGGHRRTSRHMPSKPIWRRCGNVLNKKVLERSGNGWTLWIEPNQRYQQKMTWNSLTWRKRRGEQRRQWERKTRRCNIGKAQNTAIYYEARISTAVVKQLQSYSAAPKDGARAVPATRRIERATKSSPMLHGGAHNTGVSVRQLGNTAFAFTPSWGVLMWLGIFWKRQMLPFVGPYTCEILAQRYLQTTHSN